MKAELPLTSRMLPFLKVLQLHSERPFSNNYGKVQKLSFRNISGLTLFATCCFYTILPGRQNVFLALSLLSLKREQEFPRTSIVSVMPPTSLTVCQVLGFYLLYICLWTLFCQQEWKSNEISAKCDNERRKLKSFEGLLNRLDSYATLVSPQITWMTLTTTRNSARDSRVELWLDCKVIYYQETDFKRYNKSVKKKETEEKSFVSSLEWSLSSEVAVDGLP